MRAATDSLRFNCLMVVSWPLITVWSKQSSNLNISFGVGNLVGVSPNLGPLADNGGLTQTHALLDGSPAIDAGDPGIGFDASEFDQRDAPSARVVDGEVNGLRIDIGAYEFNPKRWPSRRYQL